MTAMRPTSGAIEGPMQYPDPIPAPGRVSGPPASNFTFTDVYLLISSGPDGSTAVGELQLGIGPAGLWVSKTDGNPVWTTDWGHVKDLAAPERAKLPGGKQGVVLVVVTQDDRAHRFVVPSAHPAAFEDALARFAGIHGALLTRRR